MFNISTITTLYVSQKFGDNECSGFYPEERADGTGPLKSVESALNIVRGMRLFGAYQPVTIKIVDEVYCIDKPIVIKNDVSSVTIEPYIKTLISAGKKVENFCKDEYNGVKCISADVSELIDNGAWFTDFYVNGSRAKLTRYPENGTLTSEQVETMSYDLLAHSKWFIADKEDLKTISGFKNFGDCIISFNHYWVDEHTPIESYDFESGKIVFKYPSVFTIEPTSPSSRLQYIIENTAENFKNPGEWYLDRETKRVYYIPQNDAEDCENIQAFIPVCDEFFSIEGEADKKVNNIIIRGFDMAYSKGEYRGCSASCAKTDEEEIYASELQAYANLGAGVEFSYAHGCAIENCRMYCVGLCGVVVHKGCDTVRICNNSITNGGGGGISVLGEEYGTEEKHHTYGITISDNEIEKCGRRYLCSCGIIVRHSYNNLISHNTVSDMFYTGISVGWVWGYAESITHDNIIEYNHIFNIGQRVLSDMGGVYLLGKQRGTIVRNNLIHDVEALHYGGWGIYTDEGSSYVTVENNICYNMSQNAYHQHYGNMNTVRNNIFAFAEKETLRVSRHEINTGIIFDTNIIISDSKPMYSLSRKEKSAWTNMVGSANNIIYDVSGREPVIFETGEGELSIGEVQAKYGLENGSVWLDPLFENVKECNFELNSDSPVFDRGFKRIDMKSVGKS